MKIWVLSRKFATHSDSRPRVNSWNKHGSLKIDLSSIQTILWYTHCEWRWKCVILRFFNLPSVKMLIFSLEFDQSYPFTQMTQKVCQKSKLCKLKKNWEILSKLRNSEPGGRPDSKEGRGGEAVEAFLKEAQLIRNYPVYKFSGDDKALDLVWRDH